MEPEGTPLTSRGLYRCTALTCRYGNPSPSPAQGIQDPGRGWGLGLPGAMAPVSGAFPCKAAQRCADCRTRVSLPFCSHPVSPGPTAGLVWEASSGRPALPLDILSIWNLLVREHVLIQKPFLICSTSLLEYFLVCSTSQSEALPHLEVVPRLGALPHLGALPRLEHFLI